MLELMPASREQLQALVHRGLAGLSQQRGLADAGRALDDHEPARAITRRGNCRTQQLQLMCAFEQQLDYPVTRLPEDMGCAARLV